MSFTAFATSQKWLKAPIMAIIYIFYLYSLTYCSLKKHLFPNSALDLEISTKCEHILKQPEFDLWPRQVNFITTGKSIIASSWWHYQMFLLSLSKISSKILSSPWNHCLSNQIKGYSQRKKHHFLSDSYTIFSFHTYSCLLILLK